MKILIAYDGSDCADAALKDLRRAGLPETAAATVLTAADVFLPPPIREEDNRFPFYFPAGVRRAHKLAAKALEEARGLAERAASRVRKDFPQWDVKAEACADSPAWALIKKADEWKPDLVVVGAHGHNVLGGRLILGSVSQRVLYEARCSVRVARAAAGKYGVASRILVGVDGSADSEAAIDAVARRVWPAGSKVRIVGVLGTVVSVTHTSEAEPSGVKWVEVGNEEDWRWVKDIFESSAEKLRKAGLKTKVVLKKGNPKRQLLKEAEAWRADSIFVGAKGTRGVDRLLLGSVSAAVAASAPCSVEVVRFPQATMTA